MHPRAPALILALLTRDQIFDKSWAHRGYSTARGKNQNNWRETVAHGVTYFQTVTDREASDAEVEVALEAESRNFRRRSATRPGTTAALREDLHSVHLATTIRQTSSMTIELQSFENCHQ